MDSFNFDRFKMEYENRQLMDCTPAKTRSQAKEAEAASQPAEEVKLSSFSLSEQLTPEVKPEPSDTSQEVSKRRKRNRKKLKK
jgi:hypothetical protein